MLKCDFTNSNLRLLRVNFSTMWQSFLLYKSWQTKSCRKNCPTPPHNCKVLRISHILRLYNHNLRVVILNPDPWAKFERNFCGFPGSACMNAPFFLKTQYIDGLQKIYLFFPWRSPMMTYFPLNECKYRNYSLFCEMGGFWKKGRTPGESWPKCLQWTQLFSKISIGSLRLLVEEKIVFQNSKFPKMTLIWRYLAKGNSFRKNNVK